MNRITVILGIVTLSLVAVLYRWETTVIPVGYLVRTDRWTGTVWVTAAGKPIWRPVEEPFQAVPLELFQSTATTGGFGAATNP